MATKELFQPNKSPIFPKPGKIMDLAPSKGLATGLSRISGRRGTTRLGRDVIAARRGRAIVSHRY